MLRAKRLAVAIVWLRATWGKISYSLNLCHSNGGYEKSIWSGVSSAGRCLDFLLCFISNNNNDDDNDNDNHDLCIYLFLVTLILNTQSFRKREIKVFCCNNRYKIMLLKENFKTASSQQRAQRLPHPELDQLCRETIFRLILFSFHWFITSQSEVNTKGKDETKI